MLQGVLRTFPPSDEVPREPDDHPLWQESVGPHVEVPGVLLDRTDRRSAQGGLGHVLAAAAFAAAFRRDAGVMLMSEAKAPRRPSLVRLVLLFRVPRPMSPSSMTSRIATRSRRHFGAFQGQSCCSTTARTTPYCPGFRWGAPPSSSTIRRRCKPSGWPWTVATRAERPQARKSAIKRVGLATCPTLTRTCDHRHLQGHY